MITHSQLRSTADVDNLTTGTQNNCNQCNLKFFSHCPLKLVDTNVAFNKHFHLERFLITHLPVSANESRQWALPGQHGSIPMDLCELGQRGGLIWCSLFHSCSFYSTPIRLCLFSVPSWIFRCSRPFPLLLVHTLSTLLLCSRTVSEFFLPFRPFISLSLCLPNS